MFTDNTDELAFDHNDDGVDRRGFLRCMAWAGTGAVFLMEGGVLKSYALGRLPALAPSPGQLSFVQISDSHMGFNKAANPDVVGTLKTALDKIDGLSRRPEFMLHTGDITICRSRRSSTRSNQILKSASVKDVFFVPGEHDVLEDEGKAVSGALRQGRKRRRLVQLRQERRPLHWPRERADLKAGGPRHARRRAARLAAG
jgi:hypothetical protein